MKIAVLMGGISAERKISLKSGKAVYDALRGDGQDVAALDVESEDLSCLQGVDVDVVFPALHGRFGEDGGIQALLEQAGIPYVGSDPQASRAAMDKMAAKCFFVSHDVPTPPFRLITADMPWETIEQAVYEIGLPLMVKPTRQGSSVGITRADKRDDVATGLAAAFRHGRHALLERCVNGREFTVSVLEDRALPIVELRPKQKFFDYFAKYHDEATEFIVRPDLPDGLEEELQRTALEAHRCLGCEGLSRVDMMVEHDGRPYALEVNTIPGFTERSLFPLAARAAGIEFPQLCVLLCQRALDASRKEKPARV